MAAEINGTVKITHDPKGFACEVDANLLQQPKSHELEGWVHFLP
ncbi:hypothetical protein [Ensifer adhaerens]